MTNPPPPPPPSTPDPTAPLPPEPEAAAPISKKKRRLPIILAIAGVLLVLCCGGVAINLATGNDDRKKTNGQAPATPTAINPATTVAAPTPATTEPAPTSPAAPPPAPAAPKDITYQGHGDKILKIKLSNDISHIAVITHRGSSNFAVSTLTSDGNDIDLLVNEIGNYSGTRPLDFSDTPAALKINADGNWKIIVRAVSKAPRWSGKSSGRGDAVLQVAEGAAEGLTTVKFTHSGSSNFAVQAYSDSGADLLINEIGKYSGEVLLPSGTLAVEITANGAWTMQKT